MVINVTNLGRSGVHDWIIQRVTAVVVGAYVFFILGYLMMHPGVGYMEWRALFDMEAMRLFSFSTLIAIVAHAWIGVWTISTDYIKQTGIRFLFQTLCGVAMFVYFVWGIEILWGV
jgi:succinate dehydrogenase / fumarate reductase, membrane anchor subunit